MPSAWKRQPHGTSTDAQLRLRPRSRRMSALNRPTTTVPARPAALIELSSRDSCAGAAGAEGGGGAGEGSPPPPPAGADVGAAASVTVAGGRPGVRTAGASEAADAAGASA